ncbi:MAG: acyl carrier protein [Salinibacterium sp.]|nr:acyl carrier protein [Salinibacterium sp.]
MTAVDTVRHVIDKHGKLKADVANLAEDADLYAAGMTSNASVNVMLAVEDAFDIEFPDELLSKCTFTSIGSICSAVKGLLEAAA